MSAKFEHVWATLFFFLNLKNYYEYISNTERLSPNTVYFMVIWAIFKGLPFQRY